MSKSTRTSRESEHLTANNELVHKCGNQGRYYVYLPNTFLVVLTPAPCRKPEAEPQPDRDKWRDGLSLARPKRPRRLISPRNVYKLKKNSVACPHIRMDWPIITRSCWRVRRIHSLRKCLLYLSDSILVATVFQFLPCIRLKYDCHAHSVFNLCMWVICNYVCIYSPSFVPIDTSVLDMSRVGCSKPFLNYLTPFVTYYFVVLQNIRCKGETMREHLVMMIDIRGLPSWPFKSP